MTAVRDFGAKRSSGFWRENVVTIACDGLHPAGETNPGVRSVTAAQGRREAKARGWRVGVKDPRGGKPRDYCPAHTDGSE